MGRKIQYFVSPYNPKKSEKRTIVVIQSVCDNLGNFLVGLFSHLAFK